MLHWPIDSQRNSEAQIHEDGQTESKEATQKGITAVGK